jgi:raw score 10.02
MAKNDYTYDNGKTRKGRVNVWELEKRVKKLEAQIQIISRHVNHQAELNQHKCY